MSEEERETFSPISFRYEYASHGWAHAWLSDGVTTLAMNPSYVNGSYPSGDPLVSLVGAVVKVLTYGGEAECVWEYEPAADRWTLRRDGDSLCISIHGERGEVRFSATCDLWKFAAKVRLAVSRLEPVDEQYYNPTGARRSPEYRVLCRFLEEHKRAPRPRSS